MVANPASTSRGGDEKNGPQPGHALPLITPASTGSPPEASAIFVPTQRSKSKQLMPSNAEKAVDQQADENVNLAVPG